eukprot:EG_transcript_7635
MPLGCPFRCPGRSVAPAGGVVVVAGPASAALRRHATGVPVIVPEGSPQGSLHAPGDTPAPRHLRDVLDIALGGGAALLDLGADPNPDDLHFIHLLTKVGLRVTTALAYVDFAAIRSVSDSPQAAAEHMAGFAEAFEYTAAPDPTLTLRRSTVEAEIVALAQPAGGLPPTEGPGLLRFVNGMLGLRMQDSVGLRPRRRYHLALDCTDLGRAWQTLWAAHGQAVPGVASLMGSNAADDDGCGDPGLPRQFFMVKQLLTVRAFTDIYKGTVEEDAEWVGQVYKKLLTTGTMYRLTDRYGRIAASCEKKESIFHFSTVANLRYVVAECSRRPRTRCADEGEPCRCRGTVQLTSDGRGVTPVSQSVSGEVQCTAAAFAGDPAPNRRKYCECVDDDDHQPWRIEADYDRLFKTSLFVWYNVYQGDRQVARVRKMADHASEVLVASPLYNPDDSTGHNREGQVYGTAEQDFSWFRTKFDVRVTSDVVPPFIHAFCAFTEFGKVRPDALAGQPNPRPGRF